MINIFKSSIDGQFHELDTFEKGCWVNLVNPTEPEIQLVSKELGIEPNFLRDPLDEEEKARIEKEDNILLIIVDIPILNIEDNECYFDTIPLGMIVVDDSYFVTVCLKENPILNEFAQNRIKGFFTFKKTRFILQLLYRIATYYLRYLKQINRKTDEIEKQLHKSMKNQELFSLLNLEKSLVYFTTSLRANEIVMEKLLRGGFLKMYPEDEDLMDDTIIENKQAIEMAHIYSNILSGMMDAFASVISNNLNMVMKFLTSITIVLAIPTMVASFFGMNVSLPFQNNEHAFTFIILLTLFVSFATTLILAKRKLF
ncbi:Mg2 transporter protein CorA family protein [Thermincola ferriacetica]|uniref:Mg2 transporter protein CorA family protein n=1 Tax=Thermincola ferriacetica TaxID=281456 RepID=A0A0L6VY38_9FIRM|nr:magnesium transporter CorA family protein [Thermincola ferriacetica]KNZ68247.1 Mg2 transporter protein CorA family protein [Thermincola ferriacetica]